MKFYLTFHTGYAVTLNRFESDSAMPRSLQSLDEIL